jgi:hypothetical protein
VAYLRRKRRRKGRETYEYWALVESVRTARGPRQRTVAMLGKAPGLDADERLGWDEVAAQLSGRGRARQGDLIEAPEPDAPDWATVDVRRVRVERLRRFGDVFVALTLWRRLRLDEALDRALPVGREAVPWAILVCLHAVARVCEPTSDLALAESFFAKTALDDLLGLDEADVYDNRLYRALDAVLPVREALFEHLRGVYGELFGATFDILLYDVTSTYFEGQADKNALAARGYSRDSRPDCKQVCIGLVVTPDGLPLAYEVFAGNRTDVTTLDEIVALMERRYGRARRVWVVDRGLVSEDNLAMLRRRGARYICGTPRSMLRHYERALLGKDWEQVAPEVEAKLVEAPPGKDADGLDDPGVAETFLLCRSRGRTAKDRAIVEKAAARLEEGLNRLKASIETGRLRDAPAAERRVGRLLGTHTRAARLFHVEISQTNAGRLTMKMARSSEAEAWAALSSGCYLLRTNLGGQSAAELWRAYIDLTEAESAFRELKGPLDLRPVYHQRTDRVQAHILVCFLALAMRRTLRLWMRSCGLGTAVQRVLDELKEIRSLDVVLTGPRDTPIRLRVVSTPEPHVRPLLHRLALRLPNRPKRIQNVVPTFAPPTNVSPTESSTGLAQLSNLG